MHRSYSIMIEGGLSALRTSVRMRPTRCLDFSRNAGGDTRRSSMPPSLILSLHDDLLQRVILLVNGFIELARIYCVSKALWAPLEFALRRRAASRNEIVPDRLPDGETSWLLWLLWCGARGRMTSRAHAPGMIH